MTTPSGRRPVDTAAAGIMVLLCLCWGFQQIAIKLVATDVAPVMQIAIRSAFGMLVLGAFIIARQGLAPFRDGSLPAGLVVGLLFAGEFLFVAQGLNYTLASHVSVFLYTSPIFAALGLHIRLPEERLSALQWLGVVIAFGGIAMAFLGGGTGSAGVSNMLLGDFFGLLAGASWGLTTVAIRTSRLSEAPASKTLFYQVTVATLLLGTIGFVSGQSHIVWSQAAIISLVFQSVVVSLLTFLVWFWLLRRYLASRISILSFMTPLFAVVLSVLILHETLTPTFVAGAALVLVGILLVSGAELLGRRRVAA